MKRDILTDVLARRPKITLYHYTTQSGLLGIIKCRTIWATHTQYLNDTREYRYAQDIVRGQLQAEIDKCTESESLEILEGMKHDVQGVDGNVCVCSFSEEPDLLSQWRAYTPATAGFAIGIRGEQLAQLVSKENFFLARCIYERPKQEELIRALIARVFGENMERRKKVGKDVDHLPRGGNLHFYLHRYAPVLKDPSFHEEREWRVISGPLSCGLPRFDFRVGRSMLVPYYRFPLADDGFPLQLHEVVVGPTPDPEQAARSVKSLLVKHHLSDVLIKNSTVPYRHW